MWIETAHKYKNLININLSFNIYVREDGACHSVRISEPSMDEWVNIFLGDRTECEKLLTAIGKAIANDEKFFSVPDFHAKYLDSINGSTSE